MRPADQAATISYVSFDNALIARVCADLGLVPKARLDACLAALAARDDRFAPSILNLLLEQKLITAQDVFKIVERAMKMGDTTTTFELAPEVRPLLSRLPDDVKAVLAEPGNYFGNRYILVRQMGSGFYGEVWKAWDAVLGRYCALKFTFRRIREELPRFQQEALLAARLNHPNIPGVYDVGQHELSWYIAMEFVDGTPLDTLVNENRLGLKQKLAILRDAALAIDYAHKNGVLHRDITPWNIMLDRDGRVFVLDFGLAKSLDVRLNLTKVGESIGAIYFVSPEQARGDVDTTDVRSDVYMLGSTLYFVLTGRHPFEGLDRETVKQRVLNDPVPLPSKIAPECRSLDRLVARAMHKDLAQRYPTAADFAQALDRQIRRIERHEQGILEIVAAPVEDYITNLGRADDPVLERMEELAARQNFPIVGPQVGRVLWLLARMIGAKRVLELGSGFGYSAYWFALAGAHVLLTDRDAENLERARTFLSRFPIETRQGDALDVLRELPGPFDIIFNDVDKRDYPAVLTLALPKLRQGGLLISDNALWSGSVVKESEDPDTRAIREYNRLCHASPELLTTILPIRDGLSVSLKL